MEITLYQYNDNANIVNKKLDDVVSTTVDIVLKNSINNVNSFSITLKNIFDNIYKYNYCYIPKLKRYYFIDNINIISNELIQLNLKCDLLKTYENDIINNIYCDVIECENNYNIKKLNADYEDDFINTNISIETPFINSGNKIVMVVRS